VTAPVVSEETVDYRRSIALPGVEVIDARNSPREWRQVTSEFAVVVFKTWRGRVRTLGNLHSAAPGIAFCVTPGQAFSAKPDDGPGSFNVLQFRPDVLDGWLSEQGFRGRPHWSALMKPLSPDLSASFRAFFDIFEPAAPAMELQSRAIDLSEGLVRELVDGANGRPPLTGPALRATAQMREYLNEEGLAVDLDTLAQRVGLSRFQALRSFKQRYGLPPHTYQLCLRIERARRLLLEGASLADIAARCEFADQSHLTRHFKRVVGVTPMQYARAHEAGRRSARAFSPLALVNEPLGVVSRSDY
jgi:AraC-like DNA-binding protein